MSCDNDKCDTIQSQTSSKIFFVKKVEIYSSRNINKFQKINLPLAKKLTTRPAVTELIPLTRTNRPTMPIFEHLEDKDAGYCSFTERRGQILVITPLSFLSFQTQLREHQNVSLISEKHNNEHRWRAKRACLEWNILPCLLLRCFRK